MISEGDVLKLKLRGRKEKFQVMGPHDRIEEGCLQSLILDHNPLCYSETLYNAYCRGLNNLAWGSVGYTIEDNETVSDMHTGRIYLKPIPF